jgi:hypothetical protein
MTDWDSYAEGWNKCADDMDKRERCVKLCPRPINDADCNSAAWCVLSGNCGCDHGMKIMLRSNPVYASLHTAFQNALRDRDIAHSALVSLVAVSRRYLPDYDEHAEIQKADDALELLTPNDEHKPPKAPTTETGS